MRYLVSYDISDDGRRRQVVKRLKRCGVRVQYSVFETELDGASVRQLWRDLCGMIELDQDGLLLVPLCQACHAGRREAGSTRLRAFDDDEVI